MFQLMSVASHPATRHCSSLSDQITAGLCLSPHSSCSLHRAKCPGCCCTGAELEAPARTQMVHGCRGAVRGLQSVGVGRLVPLGHAAKPGLLYLCLRQPCHSSIASTMPCPADTSHLCLWRLVPSRGASASPAAGNGSLSWVLKGAARHCCAPGPLQRSAGVLAPGAPGAGAWGGPRLVPVSVPEGRCCL